MATKTGERYVEAVGRRKTSTARVRIYKAAKTHFIINGKETKEYFKTEALRKVIAEPLQSMDEKAGMNWEIEARVSGGGVHSQAGAVRLGLARALIEAQTELRGSLKALGLLKRDPRAKERRKFGLKKARKAPQWSKR